VSRHPEPRDAPRRVALTDRRALRLSAAFTLAVTLTALAALSAGTSMLLGVLLGWQTAVFALGAWYGPSRSPYRPLVARLLAGSGPGPLEPVAAARFAQACGLVVLSGAVVALAVGAVATGAVLLGVVAVLSGLLAGLDVCLGCRLYGLLGRLGLLR
jgi:hypothetical protein